MSEEYILNDSDPATITSGLSEEEKDLMQDIQNLSKKMMEQNVPCFLSAKFSSAEDPVAAWHFGVTEEEALQTFATDIAPLFLYITSQMTGTKIVATNPNTDKVVYSVSPKQDEN